MDLMYGKIRPLKDALALLIVAQLFAMFFVLAIPDTSVGIKETLGHVHHSHSKLLLSHAARARVNSTSASSSGGSRFTASSCQRTSPIYQDGLSTRVRQIAMATLADGSLPAKRWLVFCSLLI